MFRNVMTYLGLGPDEEYDDGYLYDDAYDDDQPAGAHSSVGAYPMASGAPQASHVTSVPPARVAPVDDDASAVGAVRPLRRVPNPSFDDGARRNDGRGVTIDLGADEPWNSSVRTTGGPGSGFGASTGSATGGGMSGSFDRGRTEPVVRPVPIQRTKPRALSPQTFGDAKLLADDIKASVPVVMNLRGVDKDLARRLIDFASGVCYSLDASMEKLASQVFLLTPASVEVSGDERRRIEERGFDR